MKIGPLTLNDCVNAAILAMDGKISRANALFVAVAVLSTSGNDITAEAILDQSRRLLVPGERS